MRGNKPGTYFNIFSDMANPHPYDFHGEFCRWRAIGLPLRVTNILLDPLSSVDDYERIGKIHLSTFLINNLYGGHIDTHTSKFFALLNVAT